MPSGGKRSAVVEALPRSSLPLARPQPNTPPRSPVKRVSTKGFPTRFGGGDDSLSVVQDFEDVLVGGAISGQALSESQRRQPGIAKSMKTKAQSKTVSKRRKKESPSEAPPRGTKTGVPPIDGEAVLMASAVDHHVPLAPDRALETRAKNPSGSDEIQKSPDSPLEPLEVQGQAAHTLTGLVRPPSPVFAPPVAHTSPIETPIPHGRYSLRRRILAPETPVDSSRSDRPPQTPSRPRVGLQVESTGSKKARQSLPLVHAGEDTAGDRIADAALREGSTSPRSPLLERTDESRLAVSQPSERRSVSSTKAQDETYPRQPVQSRCDSTPTASQDSLHCIIYCWHRDSQTSSQIHGQSFSQSHSQSQALSASQQSQWQYLSQPQALSQQSINGATHDGERGVGFFEGMEEQPWVRVGVDQLVELSKSRGEERDNARVYRVAKEPPTRQQVAEYCDWGAQGSVR
ncbi:hypothetical protein BCV69DRAFT_296147 [Microstroma glucosiphilum]|uniref:Uncharacterized protein n=1 Tax=Pseudomicrostroma glucosiphilum TaxID=1684307 RepID=A0A316UF06_9BASI|nr:hypothetical protein BCV69DRAFT_296147 [Pseudomicrostroma glucosiphilum]PWN23836.1 hypothetical protein BCV69DRAFT_296147 [Pseudomicrostroma glucosiphilum]